jgi:hypothetical protein
MPSGTVIITDNIVAIDRDTAVTPRLMVPRCCWRSFASFRGIVVGTFGDTQCTTALDNLQQHIHLLPKHNAHHPRNTIAVTLHHLLSCSHSCTAWLPRSIASAQRLPLPRSSRWVAGQVFDASFSVQGMSD